MASLCETYWFPLYAYVRRRISDVNEAQDLTQAFFTELLDKNYIGQAIPERGKFRSFLITAFKHFLSKERDQRKAQKRGGGRSPISLDFVAADSSPGLDPERGLSPEQLYERKWTITVLGSVLERLRHELVESGKRELFEQLKHFLIGDSSGSTYAEAARSLDTTEAAAKMTVTRMRKRYKELLREEIAQTVSDPDQIDDEIRNLFTTLQL